MGFSSLMGFVGGAARAGEQIADNRLARMDANGIAQAKAQADMALQERINQYSIEKENRGYKREDFTHARGLMDDKAKAANDLQAKREEEKRLQSPEYLKATTDAKNFVHTNSLADQESSAKTKAETNKNNAAAERDRAEAKKALSEIGAGGVKPLTESEIAAQVAVAEKALRIAYNVGTDPVTGQYTGQAEDIKGYLTAFAKTERAVRNRESLPAAYVEKLFSGSETEKATAKAASLERAQRGIDNLNKNKPTLRFKDYTREEFDAMPQEEQDKAISQGKTPATPKQETSKQQQPTKMQAPTPIATRPDGEVAVSRTGEKRVWNKEAQLWLPAKTSSATAPGTPKVPQSKGLMPNAASSTSNKNGVIEKGNIDLNNLPVVKNSDGSISTVRSVSFRINGAEVLIPTIVNGKAVSAKEALDHYNKTGEHLGKFSTQEAATKYAKSLHEDQDKMYSGRTESPTPKAEKTITVHKVPMPKLPNGEWRVANLPRDGVFYQGVIYRDGDDRFMLDAQGNRQSMEGKKREQAKPSQPEKKAEAAPRAEAPTKKVDAPTKKPVNNEEAQIKDIEARYEALHQPSVTNDEFMRGLGELVKNEIFKKLHPDAVKSYREYVNE